MAETESALQLESIVQRLEHVERDIADLQLSMRDANHDKNKEAWYLKHAGKFENDPEFMEIVRLGREIRQSDNL